MTKQEALDQMKKGAKVWHPNYIKKVFFFLNSATGFIFQTEVAISYSFNKFLECAPDDGWEFYKQFCYKNKTIECKCEFICQKKYTN